MVGTVLVSHSQTLAEAMVGYAHMMAPQAVVVAAGGLEDGTFGTSYEKIETAIEQAQQGDGVVVLMTVKMVLEDMEDDTVAMADCPFVEGAVEGTVLAQSGAALAEIVQALSNVGAVHKL